MTKVTWTSLGGASREEIEALEKGDEPFVAGNADRVISHFRIYESISLKPETEPVTRWEHSLQTATRALRDGRDEEYVVCALLHDIGDILAIHNHQDVAAAILKPYVSDQNHWMVQNHALFQGYYFFHHLGADRHARDRYRDHPWYEYTAEFCELYDQAAFDPDYDSLPFDTFEPMVRRVLSTPRWLKEGESNSPLQGQVQTTGAN